MPISEVSVSETTLFTNREAVEEATSQVVQNSTPSPVMALNQLITATWISQAIYVTASLGIADLLKDGARSVEDLAQASGAKPIPLYRFLRALASVGVFTEVTPYHFGLTEMAYYLRSDVPNSLRYISMMLSDQWHWNAWGDVMHVVKTGQPAMQHLYQIDNTFEFLSKNAESGDIFNTAMVGWAETVHTACVDAYDFSGIQTIVDIAGGYGTLIAAILNANPSMQGILFDQPHVVAKANDLLESRGVSDRCKTLGGNFFESVPSGGDTYIMSHIVHDWGDHECIQFLRNIRQVIPAHGKLLIVDQVVPSGNTPHFSKLMDICMMIMYVAGKERTEEEFRNLFEAAGFRLVRILPTSSPMSILECVPV